MLMLSIFAAVICVLLAVKSRWYNLDRPLPPGLPLLHYDTFVRELGYAGLSVLGCGGGVMSDPQQAISTLRGKYGEQDLMERCYSLIFDQPENTDYPEGVDWVAMGVIYHLADDTRVRRVHVVD